MKKSLKRATPLAMKPIKKGKDRNVKRAIQLKLQPVVKRSEAPQFIQFGDMLLMIPMHFPKATQTMPFAKIAISQ
jgi:hypothetical protein